MKQNLLLTVILGITLFTSCNKDEGNPKNETYFTFKIGIGDYKTKSATPPSFDFSLYDELSGYDVYFSNIINPETGEMGDYTFTDITIGDALEITTNQTSIICKVNHPELTKSINTKKGYLEHESNLMIPSEENGVVVIKMTRAQAGAVIFIADGTHNRVNDIKINQISVEEEEPIFTTGGYFRFSYRDEFGTYVESQVTAPKRSTFIGNLVAKDNGTGIIWEIEAYDESDIIDL